MAEQGDEQRSRKRRHLCQHCNQLLAKTTYWEHQKICKPSNVTSDSESDSDFEPTDAHFPSSPNCTNGN